jgi:DNA-binding response OmpR family regulator
MSTELDWNPAIPGIPAILVGQDRPLAELHRLKLEMDGYSVIVVSVEEVIRAVEKNHPDILFVDIRHETGEDLALYLRLCSQAALRRIPMVLLSRLTHLELAARDVTMRGGDFLIHEPPLRPPASTANPLMHSPN